jgi:hypothetical protein
VDRGVDISDYLTVRKLTHGSMGPLTTRLAATSSTEKPVVDIWCASTSCECGIELTNQRVKGYLTSRRPSPQHTLRSRRCPISYVRLVPLQHPM